MKSRSSRNKMHTLTMMAALGIMAVTDRGVASEITISPGFYTEGSDVGYLCTDQTISASLGGLDTTTLPDSVCCESNGSGNWSYSSSTYSWGGDASGSETSSTVSSTEGDKNVSCIVTHTYNCSGGGTEQTDDSPSAQSFKVYLNDLSTPTVPSPNEPNSPLPMPDRTVAGDYIETFLPPYNVQIKYYYDARITNAKAIETYPLEGEVQAAQPCGESASRNQEENAGWKVNIKTSIPRTPVSIEVTAWEGGSTSSKIYDIDEVSFRKHYIQMYRQMREFHSAEWANGSKYSAYQIAGNPVPGYPIENYDISGTAVSPDEIDVSSNVLHAKEKEVECCPNI